MTKQKTIEEVNQGIAEFMGGDYQSICLGDDYNDPDYKIMKAVGYHESLDALVPVWEKLGTAPKFYRLKDDKKWVRCDVWNGTREVTEVGNYTLQEAAARATLKAIEALNESDR